MRVTSTANVSAATAACDPDLMAHVVAGLSAPQKYLSSRYFYDDEGSRLFQRIMALPEYYLTRAEAAILDRHSAALAGHFVSDATGVDVVELGSGDGEKTVKLCSHLCRQPVACAYHPIDVSVLALRELSTRFTNRVPGLAVHPVCGDYARVWPLRTAPGNRQVVLLLGSNLGNYTADASVSLLKRVRSRLRTGDLLVLGLDLKKDPATVLAAYDDSSGVTAQFNLNLLRRLNRELDANFVLGQFQHYATYDPVGGAAKSFLVSKRAQRVWCGAVGRTFDFEAGETIFTEQSQKYDRTTIERLAATTGFEVSRYFHDPNRWYAVVVWCVGPAATAVESARGRRRNLTS
jgi:L-histidine N-alpha-methyltransferase